MKNFKTYYLKEISRIMGGGTPSTQIKEYWNGEIPWITPKDLSNYKRKIITSGARNITLSGIKNSSAKLVPKGTVLLSSRAPIGYLSIAGRNLTINQGMKGMIPNLKTTTDFLYYLIKYNIPKMIHIASGSTFKEISTNELRNFKVTIPPIEMQNTIANILSAFDDKIENNNKINENLEELAQALYKHWFVDFEFPNEEGKPYKSSGGEMIESELGLIPKGWKVKEVSNLFDFVGGSQPPKKEHIYEESKGYIRFIQNRDYSGNNSYLTYIKESPRNKLCNQFDILMDKYGEAGKVRFGISGAYNVALAKINSKIEDREILRRFFEQKHIERYILNASQASTRPSVNKTVFTNMKIIYPAEIIKKTFSELSLDVIKHNLNLKKENSKLAEMRDLLLPKLMSGEIKVPVKG